MINKISKSQCSSHHIQCSSYCSADDMQMLKEENIKAAMTLSLCTLPDSVQKLPQFQCLVINNGFFFQELAQSPLEIATYKQLQYPVRSFMA